MDETGKTVTGLSAATTARRKSPGTRARSSEQSIVSMACFKHGAHPGTTGTCYACRIEFLESRVEGLLKRLAVAEDRIVRLRKAARR